MQFKVVDRKTTEEQKDILRLKETIDRLATANVVLLLVLLLLFLGMEIRHK